jgi:peptide/nickel transport system substrate-binding protein
MLRTPARSRALLPVLLSVTLLGVLACSESRPAGRVDGEPTADNRAEVPTRGGQLVAAVRTDPKGFNWYTQHDATTHLVSRLTQATLVRVDRSAAGTGDVQPWLAESWTVEDLEYTVRLRKDLRFSDGAPVTSDDVLFSFEAAYTAPGSLLAQSLTVGGERLRVAAQGPDAVTIAFPQPFGPGLRVLDDLPILPRHALAPALAGGSFATVWSTSAEVGSVVGLGPFVIAEYLPGQRLVFARNPHYFRADAAGVRLPYLDRLVLQIVPDQNTQVLQLEAGQIDMTADEVRPEDYASIRRAADAGRLQLADLGVGLEPASFWMNLKPGAFTGDPRAAWLQRDELRQAISLAVDRQHFADTVYFGAASPVYGPVTEANRAWHSAAVPRPAHDPGQARALLASIGLQDRNGDGLLEDGSGTPARFALLTMKGQTALERGAAVIRDELKKIGLVVDVVAIEGNSLIDRFLTGKGYDAIYFLFYGTDTDPAMNLDYWLSSGNARVWNFGQKTPATPWEAEIDALMVKQVATTDAAERKRLFDQVQAIFARHLPIVHFAAPRIFVAASTRVTNLTPAISRPQLLWAAETIAVRP